VNVYNYLNYLVFAYYAYNSHVLTYFLHRNNSVFKALPKRSIQYRQNLVEFKREPNLTLKKNKTIFRNHLLTLKYRIVVFVAEIRGNLSRYVIIYRPVIIHI